MGLLWTWFHLNARFSVFKTQSTLTQLSDILQYLHLFY
jgi:hypothetical protein